MRTRTRRFDGQIVELRAHSEWRARRRVERTRSRQQRWRGRLRQLPPSVFAFLEACKNSKKALIAGIQEAWIDDVSTRRIDHLVQAMGFRGSASRRSPSRAKRSRSARMCASTGRWSAMGRICGLNALRTKGYRPPSCALRRFIRAGSEGGPSRPSLTCSTLLRHTGRLEISP
jgi:hypothetical protein